MSRREGFDRLRQPCDVFRLAGEENFAVFVVAIEQRTDADRVSRRNQRIAFVIIKDQRILRVEHLEHVCPVPLI
ncbi:hypothetical protein SDC9_168557 [bioreactor metagenome]|uniref:Uncharacterized protein n=1 Tax=bioreactor metagenome TaxID=1076179 RepID=A0A645G2U7_9ZZZZ